MREEKQERETYLLKPQEVETFQYNVMLFCSFILWKKCVGVKFIFEIFGIHSCTACL
jgi:hypothetical protein